MTPEKAKAARNTHRAFIALPIPTAVVVRLTEMQTHLQNAGLRLKWVRPDSFHLTLKFLGDTPEDDLRRIGAAVAETAAAHRPIRLTLKGAGAFPTIKRPRVVWAGLSGDLKPLFDLQRDLESRLADIGFPEDARSFKVHLTLARVKGKCDVEKLAGGIDRLFDTTGEAFTVNRMVLYTSKLRPDGPVYSEIAGEPLACD